MERSCANLFCPVYTFRLLIGSPIPLEELAMLLKLFLQNGPSIVRNPDENVTKRDLKARVVEQRKHHGDVHF
jgi:hypothetical protein